MTAGGAPVRVRFLPEDLVVEAPAGTALQAIADAAEADITFGCRSGSCGTCRIRVLAGMEHCSAPAPEERDFLQGLGAPADHRLACQVRVEGDVELEYLGLQP
jgi:ferredoxin